MVKNMIQSFRSSAARYKNKTALINGDLKFTYFDIDRMSNKVCKFLERQSIGKENVVAIYMDRSYLSVVSVLGILKAGAAFLPIDSKTPVKRACFMAEISKATCMIRDSSSMDTTDECSISSVDIYEILSHSEEADDFTVSDSIDDSSLAYILFTSGSTGLPKGAMIEHGGMNNQLSEKIRILHLTENSIVAHNASISFDVSIWQMLSPLCVGGSIVVFPEKSIINLRSFVSILCDNNVHVLEVVPTYLSLLIQEMKHYPNEFKNLNYLISTGEILTKHLVTQCFEVLPEVLLVNAYGPTEASDDITHCVIRKHDTYEPIPIGKPIRNAEISIVRPDGSLCGMNEPGELIVSGICVGRGYVGNADETKLCFQYDAVTGKRIYKTGDLVSLQNDGNYYFHDRMDLQIAFHGKRVEVKEIENTMLQYSGIHASAVVYHPKNQQINAYYVGGDDIDVNELKSFLRTLLPSHMIPVYITRIEKMPINLSGKTDYHALLEFDQSHAESPDIDACPSDEKDLLKIVMRVIGVNQLPDDTHWKEDMRTIGYNSINAIKLIIEMEETFDMEIEDEKLIPEVIYNFYELEKLIHFQDAE